MSHCTGDQGSHPEQFWLLIACPRFPPQYFLMLNFSFILFSFYLCLLIYVELLFSSLVFFLNSNKERYLQGINFLQRIFRLSSEGESFSSQQLQDARDEYDDEATLFVFRLKSLKQGQVPKSSDTGGSAPCCSCPRIIFYPSKNKIQHISKKLVFSQLL